MAELKKIEADVQGKIDKILKEIDDFDRQFGAEQESLSSRRARLQEKSQELNAQVETLQEESRSSKQQLLEEKKKHSDEIKELDGKIAECSEQRERMARELQKLTVKTLEESNGEDVEANYEELSEEEKEEASQKASLKVLRAVKGIKGCDEESFLEALKALEVVLMEQFPLTGELEGEFQEEAKVAVEAKAKEFSSLLSGSDDAKEDGAAEDASAEEAEEAASAASAAEDKKEDEEEDAETEEKKKEEEEEDEEEAASAAASPAGGSPPAKVEVPSEEPPKPKAVPKEENNEMTQQRAELKILRAINQVRKATAKSFAEARANLEKVIADELPHAGAVAEELSAEAEHASQEMAKELGLCPKEEPKEEPKAKEVPRENGNASHSPASPKAKKSRQSASASSPRGRPSPSPRLPSAKKKLAASSDSSPEAERAPEEVRSHRTRPRRGEEDRPLVGFVLGKKDEEKKDKSESRREERREEVAQAPEPEPPAAAPVPVPAPMAPTRPATVFNWTHRNQAQHIAEQDRKAREEKEAALKREREEALKRAENEMTDLERKQAEQVARFRVSKAIEVVAKARPGAEKTAAAEEMRRIMTEWLPKVASEGQQEFLEAATAALTAVPEAVPEPKGISFSFSAPTPVPVPAPVPAPQVPPVPAVPAAVPPPLAEGLPKMQAIPTKEEMQNKTFTKAAGPPKPLNAMPPMEPMKGGKGGCGGFPQPPPPPGLGCGPCKGGPMGGLPGPCDGKGFKGDFKGGCGKGPCGGKSMLGMGGKPMMGGKSFGKG